MSRKTYWLAYTEISGHLPYSTLFQNNLILSIKKNDIVVCLNVLASYCQYFFFLSVLLLKTMQSFKSRIHLNTLVLMLTGVSLWNTCGQQLVVMLKDIME